MIGCFARGIDWMYLGTWAFASSYSVTSTLSTPGSTAAVTSLLAPSTTELESVGTVSARTLMDTSVGALSSGAGTAARAAVVSPRSRFEAAHNGATCACNGVGVWVSAQLGYG